MVGFPIHPRSPTESDNMDVAAMIPTSQSLENTEANRQQESHVECICMLVFAIDKQKFLTRIETQAQGPTVLRRSVYQIVGF